MQVTRRTLNTGWRVREVPPRRRRPPTTNCPGCPPQVPGHVHLDLMRAGVIPDPFARLHERDVAWVDESDWVYETTFHVETPRPPMRFLRFHGLDTVAEIDAERRSVWARRTTCTSRTSSPSAATGWQGAAARTRCASRSGRPCASGGSGRRRGTRRRRRPSTPHWDDWAARSFVRKAQYMYGWDWGPVLLGCGLWQPVELVTVPTARCGDWKYDVEFTDDDKAVVTVTAEVERAPGQADTPLTLRCRLAASSDSERELYRMQSANRRSTCLSRRGRDAHTCHSITDGRHSAPLAAEWPSTSSSRHCTFTRWR